MKRLAKRFLVFLAIFFMGVLPAAAADLLVSSVDWSPESGITAGETVTLTALVTNLSASITVDFQIDGISVGAVIIEEAEVDFGPEEIRGVQITWVAEAGEHTLTVIADSTDAVEEDDETNNSLSMSLPEVEESTLVDLAVTSINTPSDTLLKIGEETTLAAVIQNNGEESLAATFTVAFFVDGTSIGSEIIGTYEPELGAGETVSVAHDWTPTSGGDHSITVTVDSTNDVAETDETNNSLDASFHVEAVDLVVEAISWEPAADLEDGQDVTFTARIRNDGADTLTVDSCAVNFAIDGASLGNASFAETDLESGETVDIALTGTVSAGDKTVTVNVDSSAMIVETNETNNTLSADLPTIVDNLPPEEITNLAVSASEKNSLSFTWAPSVNSRGDLAGYKAYFNGASEPELMPAAQVSLQKTGLNGATAYTLRISAYDNVGNESEGVTITGYIALENPTGLTAAPRPAFVELSWEPSSPESMVDHYAVYVSTTDFLTAEGTATKITTGTSVTIGGLDSQRTYHFAVVAVNLSGGMNRAVATIAASPLPGTAVSGNITTNTTWTVENSPYVVTGDITVCHTNWDYYTSTTPSQVTLTLEPGVDVRFEPGTGLNIGKSSPYSIYGYHSALSAQGTSEDPVIFTSNAATPAPGDWKGIYFHNATYDAGSHLEHCIVEYGGHTNNAGISIYDSSPTILENTIRYSIGNGIYLGDNTSATISGNTFSVNTVSAISVHPICVHLLSGNIGTGEEGRVILIRGGDVTANRTWKKQADGSLPYVVTSDITVCNTNWDYYTSATPSQVTLTLEPGVEVRFEPGTGLNIGKSSPYSIYGYHGALSAQGTSEDPVIFTSNAATPAPGDWKGIYFHNATYDAGSRLEHCTVEYGGLTNNADIYINNAKPTLQYNTIRNSSHSGVYVTGDGSDAVPIRCNNLKDNLYGIYAVSNAQPSVSGNNFLRNQTFGLYNAHAQTVTANGNWWNDPNGPNKNGDAVSGIITIDDWLYAESECIATPPTNSPPLTPRNPSPANGAVRVAIIAEGQPVPVTLSWAGGDPNPWDTVVYDLYFGTASDALTLTVESLESATYAMADLAGGTTYYWQVVARDDAGAETSGPIWSFTTVGDPPDLQVSQLAWTPTADLVAGQSITLAATITNAGSGPVVDAFKVAFAIDGATVGTVTVNPVMAAAATHQASVTWTATKGNHTLTVTADSAGTVEESYEENNALSASLPEVLDTTPPTLVTITPTSGAILQQVTSLSMTLADAHGSIADAAVIASVALVDGSNQAMTGSTVEAGDVFTFIPAVSPLPDGAYTLSFDGVDDSGNTAHFSIAFTVDGQVPAAPTLTGGPILSGTLAVQPTENQSNTATITVTGIREDAAAIYINGSQKVALGSGDWSTSMSLSQGDNTLEIWSRDAAGNVSESIFADVAVDSVAPTITGAFPTADSFLSAAPAVVSASYTETGSGLNTEACTRSLQDANGNTITGTWDFTTDGTVSFTPGATLADGLYTLSVQLEDNFTNRSIALSRAFTVDTVAPEAPVIDAVTTPTHNPSQTITGTKEAYAAISMNGTQAVANTEATTWQTTVTLASGENTFTFVAADRAGNASEEASVVIVFDDIAPDPVTTLTVNGQGSGTAATLNWIGYNEALHGDIASYRIYWQEGATFSDVAGMSVRNTVPAGTFSATATGLTKDATVWFAVVAVDKMGNFNSAVTPVSALLEDIQAPENVTNFAVSAQADSLTFTWTASANSAADLAGYRIYLDGGTEYTTLAADQLTHTLSGLGVAETHTLKITAVDDAAEPNESSGASLSGVTWLANPTGLSGEPFSGYVQLSWTAAQPSAHVKNYRVYTSDTAFSSIEDRTGSHAIVTATGTSAKVAGLTNGQTYWFAVTTVNTSDGEDPAVVAVSATPEADAEGPEISDLLAGGQAFADGYTLTGAVTLSLSASDPSGVSRVEFSLDGSLLRTDYSAAYTCYLDPADMAEGSHTLTITAYDTLDNSTTLTINFTVALALPEAPVISSPADGTTTNKPQVVVSGQALADTTVKLYANGLSGGASGAADGKGYFSIILTLAEGANSIQASAANRSGEGPLSAAVTVTLDTTLPSAPVAVTATAKSGGVIRIGWQKPSDSVISGYKLYRSAAGFTDVAQAQRVNASTLTSDSFEDVPGSDGTWYYRVTCLDAAGNESEPSSQVSAVADSIAPRAVSIVYTPEGAHDADTGTMAPGTVNLVLTVSETLQAIPFLSITPSGATPIAVDLTQIDDTTYGGFFVISDTTPSGNAWAVFSGRDMVGNRGTEIDTGGTLSIDTDGPSVHRLVVTPPSPIQNDMEEPVTVTAVLGLSEAVKAGTLPDVGYRLSGDGRETVTVDSLAQLATVDGDGQTFQAVFTLPADAGAADAESLSLTFSAVDDLDNAGSTIDADNRFQVYQGDLPPLEAPDGLTGTALSGGRVRLAWNPVDEAVAYQIYRQGPADTGLAVLIRLDDGSLTEYVDATEADGDYTYALTSIRSENGQEAESGLSDTVTVTADSVAPGTPTDFALELVTNGIKATWNPPAYTEPVTYRLYRAPQTEITDIDGLDALAEGIEQTLVVDPNPSDADHCYTVTAVDAAGNESPPAASAYLNFDLLPVSSLDVLQSESDAPVISWTHSGGTIAGFHIYLGSADTGVQLNDSLLTDEQYTDIGWSEDQRQYTVMAVDADGVSSLGRGITLPVIEASLADDAVVRRGLMNRLPYTVENRSTVAVDTIQLQVVLGGRTHSSETFSLAAGARTSVDVIVGGYADLIEPADLTTTIVITPETNETVRIVRRGQVSVSDGMLVLQIANEPFTRGGTGTVWFTLENTGDAEIEIVTARSSGNSDSDQITFTLLDEDENVITAKAFRQAVGDGAVTLADKRSVARIGAGETFTAAATTIDVPSTAPDDVTVRLSIGNVYYHLGRDTEVNMAGLSTTHAVNLEETAYIGQLDAINPGTSSGDEDIVITGQAIERAGGDPLGGVPLNLIVTNAGFEQSFTVYTESDGSFSHTYTPAAGASGIFSVRVMHPDLTDKPVHGQFVISRVSLSPTTASLSIPYNYTQAVTIKASTGEGTAVTNLRLEYLADDQPGDELATGIHVTLGDTVTALAGGGTANLPFSLWADNTAAKTASLVLRVASDENARWGLITVNTAFSEAQPVLKFSPDHIETGMAIDGSVTETLTLSNTGLAAMTDVNLALLAADGSAAPAWAVLNGSGDVGDLAVGDEYEASVTFSPGEDVAEGVYSLILRVTSSNYAQTDIHIYASVTQSGVGSAAFKISDIYTGTLDDSLQVIQGLSGAKVVLENEAVSTESYTQTSDTAGEAFFENLPAGRYKARITASNHQEYTGSVWIKPGITTTEDIFLEYNLVTVEWSVTETTIQDSYDIVLTATYETSVPAAVVGISPTSITLPAMQAGDVYNGEITLTNYGLIRADALTFSLPADDDHFSYEFSGNLPETIGAKQQVTIPYRVTCISPLEPDSDGSGGGCGTYVTCMTVNYGFECTNGVWTSSSARHCWTRAWGSCSSGGTSGSSSSVVINAGSGGGTTSGSYTPSATTVSGVKCWKEWLLERYNEAKAYIKKIKDTATNVIHEVGCSVNTLSREFNDDSVDLVVKVPGGRIAVQRLYYGDTWHFDHLRHNLSFTMDALGTNIGTMSKGGVKYEATSSGSNIFVHDNIYRITMTTDGALWEDNTGQWKSYDVDGRMTAYGVYANTVCRLVYEGDRLVGLADRNDRQVVWYEYDGDGNVVAVRDADNRQVTYTYTGGLLTNVKDLLDQDTAYQYDGDGRMIYKSDAAGRPTFIAYDSYGNVSAVTDQNQVGHFFEYDYDTSSDESYARMQTTSGMVKEIWYDKDGDTIRVDINGRTVKKIAKDGRNLIITDEKGNITRKNYDQWDNLTQLTNPDGSVMNFTYDLRFNKVSRVEDPLGNVTTFSYDDAGNLIEKVEAAGSDVERTTTYTYDDANQLLSATIAGENGDVGTSFTYDESGNLATMTDPEENQTRFVEYDAMGNLLRMIDPAEHEWKFAYDDAGRLVSQTDPLEHTTAYEYDGANNRTAVINAVLKRFDFVYDDHNNLIRAIDPYEEFIATTFNSDNLPTAVTDQEGKTTTAEYDNEGRLIQSIDGAENATAYTYDETTGTKASSHLPVSIQYPTFTRYLTYDVMDRVIRTTDDLGGGITHTTRVAYDLAGRVKASVDEEGNETGYNYDALGRLVKTTDAFGNTVDRIYDTFGNLVQVRDPNKGNTFFQYDRNNRLTRIIRPMLEETTYAYDALGNRTSMVDTKGQRIAYEYNAVNRLTHAYTYAAGDHTMPVKTVTFEYDTLGRITAYEDGTTSGAYAYDDLGRKVSETVDYGAFSKTMTTEYYANGLKRSFSLPDSDAVTYAYDENNRLAAVGVPGEGQVTTTYDAAHWNSPASVLRPGGSRMDYAYDPIMQVTAMVARDPGANIVMSRNREYSAAGTVTTIGTEHGQYSYQYDALHRLVQAGNPVLGDEAYTYDPMGNRLTSAKTAGTWSYNANNQLLGFDTTSFVYDGNGNLTARTVDATTTTYVYDEEDRMVRVAGDADNTVAEYYYDPFGRRLWKDVDGVRTCYLYSDEGLVAEYDVAGADLKQYGWNPGGTWGTDPLFLKQNGSYYWYQNDGRGAPQKLIAGNGSVVWSGVYDAFGNCQVLVEGVVNNLRLPGQYFDAETGLHYNLNRYYDPVLGRYLRVDPLGDGLNLYAYCFNNPMGLIDPLGLCAMKKGWRVFKRESAIFLSWLYDEIALLFADNFNRTIFFPILDTVASIAQSANSGVEYVTGYDLDEIAFVMSSMGPQVYVIAKSLANFPRLGKIGRLATGYNASNRRTTWFDDVARGATRNSGSDKFVLGHFSKTGTSYQKIAAHYKASYFKVENWDAVMKGLSQDEIWRINRTFLTQQIKQGKQILFSHDPLKAIPNSFFEREVNYLRDLGYRFKQKNQWTWEAVR